MRLGVLLGIPLRLSPVTLPMMALAVWLGEGMRLAVMAGSILLHELAHIAAARLLHVRVVELELTPVGGAARMENLWRLRPGQIASVALAGPMCNLCIMVFAAALCWWNLLAPDWTAALIEQNMMILLFNLLPALPMDGGRVLCGVLLRKMTPEGAAKVGVRIGQGLAVILTALSVYGLMRGRLNITLPAAAVFLLVSAGREQRQAVCSGIDSVMGRAAELEREGALPVRWLAVGEETSVHETAARLRPGFMHLIAVYDDKMRLTGIVGEDRLMDALMSDGAQKIGRIGRNVKKNVF